MLNGPYKQTFSDIFRQNQTFSDKNRRFQTKTDIFRQPNFWKENANNRANQSLFFPR